MPALTSAENSTNVRLFGGGEPNEAWERAAIEANANAAPPSRPSRPRGPRIVPRVAGVLGSLAPRAAATWGANRFFTPPRVPAHEFGRDTLAAGQGFRVSLGTVSLAAWSWGQGPTVLLVHGWGGRAAQLAWLVSPLTAAGLRVIAFDAPGHGVSGGRQSNVVQMSRAIDAVARSQGGVQGIIAHSLGAISSALSIERGLEVDRLAFISPVAEVTPYLNYFAQSLGLPPGARLRMRQRIERQVGLDAGQLDLRALGAKLGAAVPETLMIHDRQDKEVPWDGVLAASWAWHGARLVTTDGLGHRRTLRDPAVAEHLRGFMRGAAAPKENRVAAE